MRFLFNIKYLYIYISSGFFYLSLMFTNKVAEKIQQKYDKTFKIANLFQNS
jgi:hypothetical protein